MIPNKPHQFEPASQEGLMFEALRLLPETYYVFHSFRISEVKQNTFYESETDFVVFNQEKGIICLEAKAGQIRYEYGSWFYGNGISMRNGGPFNQASSNKYKLMKSLDNSNLASIMDRCKFFHAVWFPSITSDQLRNMTLPTEGDKALVLTKEALVDPEPYLDRIFSLKLTSHIETNLTVVDSNRLVREFLCPQFNVFPTAAFESDLKKIVFHRLLREQSGILNFLDEQKSAAINGSAGTGKTMIAVEKAQRHASAGESVLFLCFNNQLKEFLETNYPNDMVHYYTIAGFACKICNSSQPDYQKTKERLEDMYFASSFPYKHVIIDEGQDFGQDIIEESVIIEVIHDIVKDESINGTFYVFYDRLQLIQARKMPDFIGELDCKLTLHRNCRNTENIATTSMRPLTNIKPLLFEGAVKGVPAKLHFCENEENERESIDHLINSLVSDGYKDIVLLTCKTEKDSILSTHVKEGKYRNKYRFTTCRKFKGLESDSIILVDVDKDMFKGSNVLLYYVGASRARLKLDVMAILSDEDCRDILSNTLAYSGKIKKPKKELAGALNVIGSLNG